MSALDKIPLNRDVSEELVVPIVVGAIIVTLNVGVLREVAVVGAFLAVFGSLAGFGLGVLSLPVYFRTGLGFSPPVSSPRFSDSRGGSDSWAVHVVSAVYYSYLAAFLGLGFGMGVSGRVAAFDDLRIAGMGAGLLVGLLFVLGQTWGATRERYSLTISDIALWWVYGALLIIPGRLWILIVGTPDF